MPSRKPLLLTQVAAHHKCSRQAIQRRLRLPWVRALIQQHGGGLMGAHDGLSGHWNIPDVNEVLEALRPRRKGRPKKEKP